MKKIKIVLLGVILAGGFLGSYNLTQAADKCCYNGSKSVCKIIPANISPSIYASYCSELIGSGYSITDCTEELCSSAVASIKTSCCVLSKSNKDPKFGKPENCKQVNTEDAKTSCPGKLYAGSCSSAKPIECGENTKETTDTTTDATGTSDSIEFSNPIGVTTVSGLLDSILNNLMGLIVIIAVIFIIIGGIMYMTSAGNEKMVTRAKQTWTGATVGLAIALASPTFLKQIKIILESNSDTGGSADAWVNKALTIKDIAINVLNFLLSVFGVLAIIALVIGGGMYLTAYGDEKKIDSGKKIITYAIIGIVVALSALVVTRQIAGLIGVMAK